MNDAVRLLLSLRIDCFCVLLLCCYLYNLRQRTSAEVVCVWRISAKTLLFTVVDIAYYAAGYAYLMGHHSLSWLLLALKLGHDLLLIYLPYSTIISIVNLMFPGKVSLGRGYLFYALPYWGAVLCILSSPLNQAVEYLDDEGLPEHGELYWFVLVVQLYYMLLMVFDPLLKLSNVQSTLSSLSRQEKMIVIGGALLAVVAGPLELWLDLPLASAGYTLGLFFIIVNFQLRRISTDPLTGLNNRNALRRYVEHVFKNADALKGTCLLFLDLDKFKSINDTYGHAEGDRALRLVSQALLSAAGEGNGFLCRYGGDEFVLVCRQCSKSQGERLARLIEESTAALAAQAHLPYALKASVGVLEYTRSQGDFYGLLHAADAYMYERKRRRSQQR